MLFIGRGAATRTASLVASTKDTPVLTVTETEDAFAAGSGINFVLIDNKVRFDVALRGGEVNQFKISSRLPPEAWINDMGTQAELIGQTTATALTFDDATVATSNLALLRSRPQVRAAAVYDEHGKLFATYSADARTIKYPAWWPTARGSSRCCSTCCPTPSSTTATTGR